MKKSSILVERRDDRIIVTLQDLGVATKKDGRSRTIFCPSLKVLGFSSKNINDAFNDFESNLSLFFNLHLKNETLDEALKSFEWDKKLVEIPSFNVENNAALQTKNFQFDLAA
jgi:cell shape-determining protein MreC